MKKIILAFVLLLSVSTLSSAVETAKTDRNSKVFSVQVGGGVNVPCDNFRSGKSQWLLGVTPAADFILGISPVDGFSIRVGYQGFKAKDKVSKFNWNYVHADICWNITDMKSVSAKHFIAKPYIEVGGAFAKAKSFGVGAGVVLGYRINQTIDIVFDGRATYFAEGDALVIGTKQCGDGSATIGLVFNF